MRNFWNFFLSYPVNDYAEDVIMKLFSATLCYNAKEWYDNLPEASIKTIIARFVGKVQELESGLETGVTGASPPTITSMGSYLFRRASPRETSRRQSGLKKG